MDSPLAKRASGAMGSRQGTSTCNLELVHSREAEKTEIAGQTYGATGWDGYLTCLLAPHFSVCSRVLGISRKRGRRQRVTIDSKHLNSLFLRTRLVSPGFLKPGDLQVNHSGPWSEFLSLVYLGLYLIACVAGFSA